MPKKRAESRKGMVVTSIALDPATHRQLALAAVEDNTAMTELIREAIQEWLARRKRGGRK